MEGNPLAVIPDATQLRADELIEVAREFNLSETTFVFGQDGAEPGARPYRVRIFSTRAEMPFAGHPTLGTAAVLRELGAGDLVRLALPVGVVPVQFTEQSGRPFGEMQQVDPTFGQQHDRSAVAEALGVEIDELDPRLPIETVSTGIPFAIVPFRHLRTLEQWTPDWHRMGTYLARTDAQFVYALALETRHPRAHAHARMVFYGGDDPATGSAAGPAVAWMVRHGEVAPGAPTTIEQGLEVHRPSRLYASADRVGDRITNVRVGGHYAFVSRGELMLP